jgi:hypothetical protein
MKRGASAAIKRRRPGRPAAPDQLPDAEVRALLMLGFWREPPTIAVEIIMANARLGRHQEAVSIWSRPGRLVFTTKPGNIMQFDCAELAREFLREHEPRAGWRPVLFEPARPACPGDTVNTLGLSIRIRGRIRAAGCRTLAELLELLMQDLWLEHFSERDEGTIRRRLREKGFSI